VSAAQTKRNGALQNVWFLIIDEVSMVSPLLLEEVDRRLRDARKSQEPFGGIAMLTTGDFLQLKPVASASLASVDESAGRALWVTHFRTVVFLRANMRSRADAQFAEVLERLRVGACTHADIALLNTRVLSATNQLDAASASAAPIPILVPSNDERQALNRQAVAQMARNGVRITRLRGVLTRKRGAVAGLSDDVRQYVHALPDSEQTSGLAPTLDLYIGMPVSITHNIATALGLANGAVGRLAALPDAGWSSRVVMTTFDDGAPFEVPIVEALTMPPFVLVELSRAPKTRFSAALPPRVVPLLLMSDNVSVKLGGMQQSFRLQQFPIVPYHASTYHKAQGLSCDKLLVWRLPTAGDSLMLYVALSRSRKLEGLCLNEPITDAVVRRAVPSLDLFNELDRLDQLQAIELRSEPQALAARRQPAVAVAAAAATAAAAKASKARYSASAASRERAKKSKVNKS
jgi:hypothetical protein